jgi:hypothetical protein
LYIAATRREFIMRPPSNVKYRERRRVEALVLALALLAPGAAQAVLYKCVNNGNATYQDQPCAKGETQTALKSQGAYRGTLAGCYEFSFGSEGKTQYELKTDSGGSLIMYNIPRDKNALAMQSARPGELERAGNGRGEHFDFAEGASAHMTGSDGKDYLQFGIFKARDQYGMNVLYALKLNTYQGPDAKGKLARVGGSFDSSRGVRIPCPGE